MVNESYVLPPFFANFPPARMSNIPKAKTDDLHVPVETNRKGKSCLLKFFGNRLYEVYEAIMLFILFSQI
jgi:hypothetical protein